MRAGYLQMIKFAAISIAISLALLAGDPVSAAGCRDLVFETTPFTVCEANPREETVRLYWGDDAGRPLGTFENLATELSAIGQGLVFAMNGGMYHPDRRPVGLFIQDGETIAPLVTSAGPGNFGLLPNGVLCLTEDAAIVVETSRFAKEAAGCQDASQSGPMLVMDGRLHPRFIPDSDSKFIRNGVGVDDAGILYAVISNRSVNFHTFARLFRDVLQTPNALYMDGKVSRLYAPDIGRNDFGFPMGPILGVVRPAN